MSGRKTQRRRRETSKGKEPAFEVIEDEDAFIISDPSTGPIEIDPFLISEITAPQNLSKIETNQPIRLTKGQQDFFRGNHFTEMNKETQLLAVGSRLRLYSSEDMIKLSYGDSGVITKLNSDGDGSIYDPLMGPINLNTSCARCGLVDCPGHYGRIEFGEGNYIYHPGYIRTVVSVLQCVCNSCSKLLISETDYHEKGFARMGVNRLKEMAKCATSTRCLTNPKCEQGGEIKPCSPNPVYKTAQVKEQGKITYTSASRKSRATETESKSESQTVKCDGCKLAKATQDSDVKLLPIQKVLEILNNISDEDAAKMGFIESKPSSMILNMILVPPNIARPPVVDGGGNIKDNDLIKKYKAIIRKVASIGKDGSDALTKIYCCYMDLLFDSKDSKVNKQDESKSIVKHIQGKEAVLRSNIVAKRVNDCGRTVAGPGSDLNFGEVGVPNVWRNILTKPIYVTKFNIRKVQELLDQGLITHIISHKTNISRFYNPNSNIQYKLELGDYVNKYLEDGDYTVCNRQPTLHKQSMMGFRIKLGKHLTITHHLTSTSPMNMDFDGDEGNLWNDRTLKTEAEVRYVLNIIQNITTAESNRPIMGLVMNSITGAYLLSDSNSLISQRLMEELQGLLTNTDSLKTLGYRLDKYRVNRLSRAAVFSMLLPADFYYQKKGVTIYEGVLVSGRLTKGTVGASHRSIIQELWKNYGALRTRDFITDATTIINKWIIEFGFTVGIGDVINLDYDVEDGGREYDKNDRILQRKLREVYLEIAALGGKVGNKMEDEYREQRITELLDVAKAVGIVIANNLPDDNQIKIMTDQGAGTKGSATNIGAIMGAVGQQYYHSKRLEATLSGGTRFLPMFDEGDEAPEAHGFISHSFYHGLNVPEFFSLMTAGREGLLDTNLKTAETGALQRLIFKTVESVIIDEDGSVRNTSGVLFSPLYNGGYDISEMINTTNEYGETIPSFIDIKDTMKRLNNERGWFQESSIDEIEEREVINQTPDVIEPEFEDFDLPEDINFTRDKITLFEKARIIGARAQQFANGAQPHPDIDPADMLDMVDVAELEYSLGVCPIFVIRRFPNGTIERVYPTLDRI